MTATLIDPHGVDGTRAPLRPRAVTLVVIAVLLTGSVLGARWYSGLSLLGSYPAERVSGPLALGHTVYADLALSARPTTDQDGTSTTPASIPVTITALAPRVVSNTSDATIRVLICRRNGGTLGVGTQEGGLSNSCSTVTDFAPPMTLTLGFMTAQVIVAVTPHRPGTVHIEGADVTYSQGLRHTTQHAGGDLTLTTT